MELQKELQRHWWKIIAVCLLLYTILAGLLTPLSTGITDVRPGTATVGKAASFQISCYNSSLEGETPRVWLKIDSFFVRADAVTVVDSRNLTAKFNLEGNLPSSASLVNATMVLDSKMEGTTLLPSAISINRNDSILTKNPYTTTPTDLHGKVAFQQFPFRQFPFRNILEETIRNLYFHVPLWFAMLIIFLLSAVYSGLYLKTKRLEYDIAAVSFTNVGVLFGILGTTTGMLWAQYTWGKAWSWDVKQNTTAISLLIYFAYFVLRNSFEEDDKRARISAVYNIFAFSMLIPLLFVIPRLTDSLHPGNGGNPAFSKMDLDNTMKAVFYPAVVGWILLGIWVATLWKRVELLKAKKMDLLD
ncbi:MAG: hypothetical protein RI894_792 [Bacteroidota bacterium]|jgi:heme exporter protein C